MIPENLRFGGGPSMTFLHPAVALALLICGTLMFVLPRTRAVVPFLVAAILIPPDQVLLIGGMHFPTIRVLTLFALARILKSRFSERTPLFSGGLNRLDLVVILLSLFSAINALLLWQELQALVAQVGELYSVFGVYFFLRFVTRDQEDMLFTIRTFAYIVAIVGVLMIYEQANSWNPYAFLGGSRSTVYATGIERDGHFRAMGSFAHPILAGTFGAVLVPLFVGLWLKDPRHRASALIGIAGATAMTVACDSSTPLIAYIAGVFALCLWPARQYMRVIRWSIVITLICLHLVMKAPVWHLISRIDLTGGSSSYHRFMLVDGFIRHFGDWWLLGTKSNADWGWCMWDQANQYVAVGQTSGLLPFLCFLTIITYGFGYVGRARRAPGIDKRTRLFLWAVGAALFANVVAFFGISYFDQTIVAWYALLGMIAAAAGQKAPVHSEHQVPEFSSLQPNLSSDSPAEELKMPALSPFRS